MTNVTTDTKILIVIISVAGVVLLGYILEQMIGRLNDISNHEHDQD